MTNSEWQLKKANRIIQLEDNGPFVEATVEEVTSRFLLDLMYFSKETVVTERHLVVSWDLVDEKVNKFCEKCFGGVEDLTEEYVVHNGKKYPFVSFLPKIDNDS